MALFLCKLLVNRQRVVLRIFQAANLEELSALLAARTDDPLLLGVLRLPAVLQQCWLILRKGIDYVPRDDVKAIVRQLAVLMLAGIPTEECLRCIEENFRKAKNRRSELLVSGIQLDLREGLLLSQAIAKRPTIFPPMLQSLSQVGDQTGLMAECLMRGADNLDAVDKIRGDLKKALIYPAFTFSAMFGAAAFWIAYVIPNMSKLFKQMNAKLPEITIKTIAISEWLVEYWGAAAILSAALLLLSMLLWSNWRSARLKIFGVMLRLPAIGRIMTYSFQAALFENMRVLYMCGVDFIKSIEITSNSVVNELHRERFGSVLRDLKRGTSIVEALERTELFDHATIFIVSAGERSGSLERQFGYLASHFSRELSLLIDNLSEILKPVIVVVAGGFFIFLISALLLPVYDLVRQTMASLGG